MKLFIRLTWAFLLLSAGAVAQNGNTVTTQGAGAPTGPCSPIQRYVDTTNNNLYFCSGGVWVKANSGFTPPITATQSANGSTLETFKRFTDVAPTGYFDVFTSNDSLTTLFSVDVSGNVITAGALAVNSASNPCGTSSPCISGAEGATQPTPGAGNDFLHLNSTAHCIQMSFNGSSLECPILVNGTLSANQIPRVNAALGSGSAVDLKSSALSDDGTKITSTETIIVNDGADAAPGLRWTSETNSGFEYCGTNAFCYVGNGAKEVYVPDGKIVLRNTKGYAISSTDNPISTPDVMVDRAAAGVLGSSSDGSTVDTKGAFKAAAFLSNNTAHPTGQTATKNIYTLCAAAVGGCNTAGQYRISWYFNQGGTACGTPGTGGVTFALTWVDNAGTHSAVALPMDDSSSLTATGTKFTFQASNTAAWASGIFNIWSTGASDIQITNTYTACGVGTGNWELAASAERLQ